MKISRICILGGTGFIGKHLIAKLAANNIETVVLTRHPQRHRDLTVNPGCKVFQANIFDKSTLQSHFKECDAVINLVGILNERKKHDFRKVHVELVDKISSACRNAGIKRLLHMSALNANATNGVSLYLRTKGDGENRAHTGGKPEVAVTSFQPSVIFGADDSFINRFAMLVQLPGLLPLACSTSKFAPVFVNDLCQAMFNSLNNKDTFGNRYEICGPRIYSLIELVRYIANQLGIKKTIIPLPNSLSKLQASILQRLPGKLFTTDNYLSLQKDSVCSGSEYNLDALGIKATHMDTIVPVYLKQLSERQRYSSLREKSKRELFK